MKTIAVVVAVLPLALAAGACSREGERSVVAPEPARSSVVREASWVTDREEVAQAASVAAAHPLVRRALDESGGDRLGYMPGYALRGIGRTDREERIAITILPFVTGGDPTHATFLSLLERGGESAVSQAEIIWGREPRSDETGFEPFEVGGSRGWIREADLRFDDPARAVAQSPERFNRAKFLTCFETLGPQLCSQGSSLASQIAPAVPYREAIGCAAGTAVAAAACAATAFEK